MIQVYPRLYSDAGAGYFVLEDRTTGGEAKYGSFFAHMIEGEGDAVLIWNFGHVPRSGHDCSTTQVHIYWLKSVVHDKHSLPEVVHISAIYCLLSRGSVNTNVINRAPN